MTYTITENENFFAALGQFVSQWKASKTERKMEMRKKNAIAEIVSDKENALTELLKLCRPATEEISLDGKKEYAEYLYKKYENLA